MPGTDDYTVNMLGAVDDGALPIAVVTPLESVTGVTLQDLLNNSQIHT